jgi:formylglycine-generating enzyme required for sulfatase activity
VEEPDVDQRPADVEAVELEDFTNSIGMKFKLIPAGEFMMGSPEDEIGHEDDETQHRVRITKPYYLGVMEVTQGQWEKVMGTRPWEGEKFTKSGPEYAVSFVNWDDAGKFCQNLSEKEGREYRLPTEAEWEYACRAGTTTRFSFGGNYDFSDLGSYAWNDGNDWTNDDENYTHEVGLKLPNAWGLYDMHGNVSEWCQDWYSDNYYENSQVDNPAGLPSGLRRVCRGGRAHGFAWNCRSANRPSDTPGIRYHVLGFRVALDPAE